MLFSRSLKTSENTLPSLPSPVPHLLSSNSPPSVSEAELIRQAIADAELVANGLPSSSDSKDDTLASEQSNSEALQARAFIAAHQAILSPLRSLPAELLEVIFTYTRNPEKPRHVPRMPVVSQVCRKWRDVAESTPAIWSDITLDLRQVRANARRREHHESFDVFGLMLDRSRQHPLRVHISASEAIPARTRQLPFRINTPDPQVDQTAHPQLLKLFATSDRWTVATIAISQCMPRADIESMLHRLHGQVPSLVSLEVTTDSLSPSALDELLCAAFADAPSLREVSLCGPWGPTRFIFPWAQLTLYKDHWSTSLDLFALDHFKTSIKELDVLWRSWNTTMVTIQAGAEGLGGTEPMVFAQLEKLKVSFSRLSHRTLLPILIIPELREISLERYPGGYFNEITAMFIRSCERQVGSGVLFHRNLRSFTCHGEPQVFYQMGELENERSTSSTNTLLSLKLTLLDNKYGLSLKSSLCYLHALTARVSLRNPGATSIYAASRSVQVPSPTWTRSRASYDGTN